MEVEIYDLTEIALDANTGTFEPEKDEEALALIAELGLNGQDEINTIENCDDEEATIIRNHYGKVNYEQQIVIRGLFSENAKVGDYKDAPIPLRILKEIKFAQDMFKSLYIFYAPPCEVIDPILVGHNYNSMYNPLSQIEHFHLIARWGDALAPWSDLFKDAEAKLCLTIEGKIKGIISNCNTQLIRIAAGEVPEGKKLIDDPTVHGLPFN